ncbi:MAG: HD-GYP domain-containing protein [Eubacterium sp.]|nr:HD-GYP domain-containing protein [Eubacterium sp.]
MEYCKLQSGCLLVLLYIVFIYYKERRRYQKKINYTLFDAVWTSGLIYLLFDVMTAYTVNHQESVAPWLNMILHGFFLVSLDTTIFLSFVYMYTTTQRFPRKRKQRIILAAPYVGSIFLVIYHLDELEYRHGVTSNYSMGASAYTCFILVAFYMLLTVVVVLRRWNYIQSRKRVNLLSFMLTSIAVTTYQLVRPESLVAGLAVLIVILGIYLNQEDPAMQELMRCHEEMVMGFAMMINGRDKSTGGHIMRTTRYVQILADALRERGYYHNVLTKDYMKNMMLAAPMHDIGKISIPDAILQKPGKLTVEEYEQMKRHTVYGEKLLRESFHRMGDQQYLEMARELALHHHEKWNGQGYPEGLKGTEIPVCTRIMTIADVFDAVSANRCYREGMSLDDCFEIIREGIGEMFDPVMAETFLELREQIEEILQDQETEKEELT